MSEKFIRIMMTFVTVRLLHRSVLRILYLNTGVRLVRNTQDIN